MEWLASIGLLRPPSPGRFSPGDAFRAKMIGAILNAGFTPEQIEWAAAQGRLNLDHVDNYVVDEPAPRSSRTFAEFVKSRGDVAATWLPTLYQALGLPVPDATSSVGTDEEALWEAFFEGWRLAPDAETPLRAARLMGEGTRLVALGWPKLLEEQIAGPARDRLLRGDIDQYPAEVIDVAGLLIGLVPKMMTWLAQRYVEQTHQHSVSGTHGITVTFEPFQGGRIYERTPGGAEHDLGEVLVWEPPHRLVYLWHLAVDRSDATEVEVAFTSGAPGEGTLVAITHRGWDRLGAAGAERRERNHAGWSSLLPHYRAFADGDP